ncbi:MAG: hypothetical protein GX541_05570 [Clostridiales bacterium]|nr:hypothetical protein [Clostridiales bacterium]
MKEFVYKPSAWLPSRDVEMLERVRNIRREDMEYTNENGYSVKVVLDPTYLLVMDMFHRISESDRMNQRFTMVCPNQWPAAYSAVAEMINRYRINCRNVHAFAMDEYADENGNVAPLTYGAGLGYSFLNHFYYRIDPDLRPPVEQWHVFTNDNIYDYSDILEETGNGGADVVYSATGWPGHTAFIDPLTEEFKADSLEEFLTLGSRLVTPTPLTICENSLFAHVGASGDVWAVPPKAATIGPRDIANARDHFEVHSFVSPNGESWQRMISRIQLYGPISIECPASITRLFKGICYVSEGIAKPFGSWTNGLPDYMLY